MTEQDAIKIIKIMCTADSWCSNCNNALLEKFGDAFPQFKELIKAFDIDAFEQRVRDVNWETNVWEID